MKDNQDMMTKYKAAMDKGATVAQDLLKSRMDDGSKAPVPAVNFTGR